MAIQIRSRSPAPGDLGTWDDVVLCFSGRILWWRGTAALVLGHYFSTEFKDLTPNEYIEECK
jgi:hypothetical protein